MRINKEIVGLIKRWRPELGNQDDIAIKNLVSSPSAKGGIKKKQQELIKLLEKRCKPIDDVSPEYPYGGSVEPYDEQREKELLND